MSPASLLIEHNLNQVMKGIKAKQATDMKDITTMRIVPQWGPSAMANHRRAQTTTL